ncbi:Glyoxalase/Bleomycin resistance protein/Dihydroxybiphenyl dioxygenase [Xylogone sp. PMI_703]|nr:Glyoxalase/Bleomycin resistance protein/Dihydroxybiphenyl dioxygenase [Xylogone sp. PMI_703]
MSKILCLLIRERVSTYGLGSHRVNICKYRNFAGGSTRATAPQNTLQWRQLGILKCGGKSIRSSKLDRKRTAYQIANMSSSDGTLPPLSHTLETCLYVKDLAKSVTFYKNALKSDPSLETPRVAVFPIGITTLLLFQLGTTASDINSPAGTIAGHGPTESILSLLMTQSSDNNTQLLKQHFCIAVKDPDDVQQWDAHLEKNDVRILGRMDWKLGGKSVYFQDPDGHVAEIGSRGIWTHY